MVRFNITYTITFKIVLFRNTSRLNGPKFSTYIIFILIFKGLLPCLEVDWLCR